MILSESEKNRIRGLYGLISETSITEKFPKLKYINLEINPETISEVLDKIFVVIPNLKNKKEFIINKFNNFYNSTDSERKNIIQDLEKISLSEQRPSQEYLTNSLGGDLILTMLLTWLFIESEQHRLKKSNKRIYDDGSEVIWSTIINPNTLQALMQLKKFDNFYVLDYEAYGNYIGTPRIGVYIDNKRGAIRFNNISELRKFIETFYVLQKEKSNRTINLPDGSMMLSQPGTNRVAISDSAGNVQQMSKKYIKGIEKNI